MIQKGLAKKWPNGGPARVSGGMLIWIKEMYTKCIAWEVSASSICSGNNPSARSLNNLKCPHCFSVILISWEADAMHATCMLPVSCICLSIKASYKIGRFKPICHWWALNLECFSRGVLTSGQWWLPPSTDGRRVSSALEFQYITKPQLLQMSLAIRFIDSLIEDTLDLFDPVRISSNLIELSSILHWVATRPPDGAPLHPSFFSKGPQGSSVWTVWTYKSCRGPSKMNLYTVAFILGTYRMLLPASSPSFTISPFLTW